MASTITYKGEVITNVTNDTKKLLTKQKYCEDDITITDITSEVVPTQTKSKTYTSNQTDTIYPDAGYNLSQVDITVNVPTGGDIESRVSRTYTSNGTYEIDPSEDYDGIEGADIVVNVPVGGDIQNSKTSSYTNNGTYHIYPDEGYDGVYDNTVTINVPVGGNVEPTRTVSYWTNGIRNITPASGYDSIAGVNINVNVPNVLEYVPQETKTGVTNTAIEIDNFAEIELPTEQTLVEGNLTEVGGGQSHLLPNQYQEVEYIESTGTQHLLIPYFLNKNCVLEYKALFLKKTTTPSYEAIFTNGVYSSSFFLNSVHNPTNKFRYYNSPTSGSPINGFDVNYNTTYRIENDYVNNKIYVYNDVNTLLYTYNLSYPNNSEAKNNALSIFSENNTPNTTLMKLYYFKVTKNNTLDLELIPCYRKSDNIVGVYDTVSSTFYSNVGEDNFNKGNDVYSKSPSQPSTITVPIIDSIVTDDYNAVVNEKLAKINNVKDYLEFNSGDSFILHKNIEHLQFTGTGIETSRELIYYNGGDYISNVGGSVGAGGIITFTEPIPNGTVVDIYYTRFEDIEIYHVTGFHNTPSDSLNITTTDTTIQLPITLTYYKDWRI